MSLTIGLGLLFITCIFYIFKIRLNIESVIIDFKLSLIAKSLLKIDPSF